MATDKAPRLRSQSTPGEQNIPVVVLYSSGSDGVKTALHGQRLVKPMV